MGRDRRNEKRVDRFTPWVLAHRQLPAWKALSFPARDAYFHLQIRCMAESAQLSKYKKLANNNGEIFRSPRDLARDMGASFKTAAAALADLQAKGWIVCTNPWERGLDGCGKTATFRLTMLPMGQGSTFQAATGEPKYWTEGNDFPVPVYATYLPKPRKGRAKNINHPPIRAHSGGEVRPNRAQLRAPETESASYSGAQNGKIAHSSASYSGAYLITICPRSFAVVRRGIVTRLGVRTARPCAAPALGAGGARKFRERRIADDRHDR